ncbi:Tol-like receptor protein with LRR domain [Psychroflexus torquis ATCC 700755]|uniref:Tol-like receptor protein with LRR domain n=1 Tax=Psychroflexus torquis (strain ATCC 700755 / CIP 106069 / ACAM 623) TaxID=313595 RepID=K4IH29_PSYTT|nr:TIR domain-containing protein [Psychroflexus torquis]AFU68376.1 Tol-like receptor protein with LRR domain [Psychroflexus torquis ATCC 700755]
MINIPSKKISKLDLSNQNLSQFPKEIFELKNLKKLNLSNNKIKSIPKEIESMKYLELLDLSNNSIINFYSKICSLKRLKVLNLNNNKIKTIPKQIGDLEALKVLQIANNKISKLPATTDNLKKLQELNLSKNDFEIFPLEVLRLEALKNLWLNNLNLKTFPKKSIAESLGALKAIYCFGNLQNSNNIDRTYLDLTKLKGNSINYLKNAQKATILSKNSVAKMKTKQVVKNKIFISYSHKDKEWLTKVQTNLKVLKHNDHSFDLWDDTRIKSGDKWKVEIENALTDSGIAILIISTDFLASDFVRSDELPTLLRNAKENGTRILPLIVRPCLFTKDKNLSEFQSVNPPDEALSSLKESQVEQALVNLTSDVSELLSAN